MATCWIGHFTDEQIKRVLKIPEKINVEAMFPIGYEFRKPVTRKIKADLDNSLYFNEYKNKKMKKIKRFEGEKIGLSREKIRR